MKIDVRTNSSANPLAAERTRRRARQRRLWLFVTSLAALALLMMFLVRPLTAAVLLSSGSSTLEQVRNGQAAPALLEVAALTLERAHALAPKNVLVLRRLGEAYTLQGRFNIALQTFQKAAALQPNSLLLKSLLAEAFARGGHEAESNRLYNELGRTFESILGYADGYFASGHYSKALTWYERAESGHGPLPDDAAFRRLVAAYHLQGAGTLLPEFAAHGLPIRLDDVVTRVPGDSLRMTQKATVVDAPVGTMVNTAFERTGNLSVAPHGLLWFAGSAGALLLVEEPGVYRLEVTARHRGAPPAEMTVVVDANELATVAVAPPEGEWQVVGQQVRLSQGLHLLELRFGNPQFVQGGEDRKLELAMFELRKLP